MQTKVKFLHPNATFKKAHPSDSGYDLTACGYEYKGNGLWFVNLGIAVEPPEGFYFEVVPRSSFAKKPFVLANEIGVIDASYRGDIKFPVRHRMIQWFNDKGRVFVRGECFDFEFLKAMIEKDIKHCLLNQRIAQAVLRKYYDSEIIAVDSLEDTERGANGFGSSGE